MEWCSSFQDQLWLEIKPHQRSWPLWKMHLRAKIFTIIGCCVLQFSLVCPELYHLDPFFQEGIEWGFPDKGNCWGSITNSQINTLRQRNLSGCRRWFFSHLKQYWGGMEKINWWFPEFISPTQLTHVLNVKPLSMVPVMQVTFWFLNQLFSWVSS